MGQLLGLHHIMKVQLNTGFTKNMESDKTNFKFRKPFIKSMCKEEQNHTKLTPPMYSLHNIHVQISGFHTLIFDFKTDSDRFSEFLI